VQFDAPLNNPARRRRSPAGRTRTTSTTCSPPASPAPPTTLYGIDFINDALVRIGGVNGDPAGGGSPNAGVVTIVGPLGLVAGFSPTASTSARTAPPSPSSATPTPA
jgi:hypothetical protein